MCIAVSYTHLDVYKRQSKTYIEEHGAPQTQDELIQHPHITYVQDLIYSDQLNFMPQVFGPGFRRFECASALALSLIHI